VLFTALDLDMFGLLAAGPKELNALAADTGLLPQRLEILLTACVGLGLLVKHGESYANAPASQSYLVRGAPSYFGDYYRFQIDRQVYPAFTRLPEALRGRRADFYRLMVDRLLGRAFAALTPGGRIVLHDFMVDDDGRGPATAALWLVNALVIDPDVARLSPSLLEARLLAQGFEGLEHAEVIPGITRTITAVKRRR